MGDHTETDVLVLGGGPTGLTLANLLGGHGVSTILVEARATTSDLPRAIVLDDEGARTVQACGLIETALADSLPGEGSRYEAADGRTIVQVGRGPTEFGFTKRHFISQPALERTLAAGLPRWPTVEARFGVTLSAIDVERDRITAHLRDGEGVSTVKAKWLIACDGGPVREALGIGFEGNTYTQDWLILDLSADPATTSSTRFICDPDRPTVVVPAPAGGRRYEFMLMPGESREDATSPDFIARLLGPHREYRAEDVMRAVVYTFHARVAEVWRRGPVLLAGDAAHLTPPFAGQGMNAGLRDAGNLAWKLALHLRGDAGAGLLDSYQAERRDPCIAMIQLAILMGKVVMPRSRDEVALQDAIMMLTDDAPALKQYLFEMRFKPRPFFERGALLRATDDVPASLVGHMLPQPHVEGCGRQARLDDLLGPGFSVVGQRGCVPDPARFTHPLWARLAPTFVAFADAVPAGVTALRVYDDTVVAPLRAHRDQLLLVRPDRYVAAAFAPDDADAVAGAFEQLLWARDDDGGAVLGSYAVRAPSYMG